MADAINSKPDLLSHLAASGLVGRMQLPSVLQPVYSNLLPGRLLEMLVMRDLSGLQGSVNDDALLLLLALSLWAHDAGHVCLRLDPEFCAGLYQRVALQTHKVNGLDSGVADATPGGAPPYLQEGIKTCKNLVTQLLGEDLPTKYPELCGTGSERLVHKPLIVQQAAGQTYIYLQKIFWQQHQLKNCLQTYLKANQNMATLPANIMEALLADTLHRRPIIAGKNALQYARRQCLALIQGLTRRLLVLSGGPGTGKTSVVAGILRLWCHPDLQTYPDLYARPQRIQLVAPTGRAARRLTEALQANLKSIKKCNQSEESLLQLEGQTLHRLLGYNPINGRFRYGPEQTIPADAIVVDESSMVDQALMARLLLSVNPQRTRLLLVGDRFQLPSVGAGAVLTQTIDSLVGQSAEPQYSALALKLVDKYYKKSNKNHKTGASAIKSETDQLQLFTDGNTDHADTAIHTIHADQQSQAAEFAGGNDAIVLLDESHRSVKAILELAEALKAGELPEDLLENRALQNFKPERDQQGCLLIAADQQHKQTHAMLELLTRLMPLWLDEDYKNLLNQIEIPESQGDQALLLDTSITEQLFATLKRLQILALLHRGVTGVQFINQAALRIYQAGTHQSKVNPLQFSARSMRGVPILIQENDPAQGLANGDMGILHCDSRSRPVLLVEDGAGVRVIALHKIRRYDLAFAITVHKSQGSEYDRVVLILPDDISHPLLTREILYTGITRARQQVWIYGNRQALQAGANRPLLREMGPAETLHIHS